MAVLWEIDPTSEDATNTPLSLVGTVASVIHRLVEMDLTPPDIEPMYATSADTEGDPFVDSRFRNRIISLTFISTSSTDALLQAGIQSIQQKLEKLRREGGTLKMTTQAGTTAVGDVNFARFKPEFSPDLYASNNHGLKYTLEFECKPLFRGAAVLQSDHAETTLPALIFTETTLVGDAPGLGKLVVDNDDATNSQYWLAWGVQSRYYDAATSAALFYEAESRTAQGGSATAVGPSGASGGGSNVMRNTALATSYSSVLSTQASGAGAHLSHVGTFRVWARVQMPTSNTGNVSVRLAWAEADFARVVQNEESLLTADLNGTWRLVDLGLVTLTKVAQGTQRWEGRILAKSTTAGDDIDVDCLFIIPTSEGYGEASGVQQFDTVTSFSARDEFDQSVGVLTGKTAPVGGTWGGAGDADDFSVVGPGTLQRTASSDADQNTGRYVTLSTPSLTNVLVQIDTQANNVGGGGTARQWMGVLARYTDVNNWLFGGIGTVGSAQAWYLVIKRVAGTTTIRQAVSSFPIVSSGCTVRLAADASGRYALWVFRGQPGFPVMSGYDAVLATGGTLATGKVGIYDVLVTATSAIRNYDNFFAAVPVIDAAVFPSQSLEIRNDRVIREDSGGTLWTTPSSYEGDYLLVPAAGKEARTARFFVKGSRNNPATGPDLSIDDISARLTYTPRYLVLPS